MAATTQVRLLVWSIAFVFQRLSAAQRPTPGQIATRKDAGPAPETRLQEAGLRLACGGACGMAAMRHGSLRSVGIARLAQSAERKALNLVAVGSSPTVGVCCLPA